MVLPVDTLGVGRRMLDMHNGGRTVAVEPEYVVREASRQPACRHAAAETVPPADLTQEVIG